MSNTKIDAIMEVSDKHIKGFFYKYRWLSNFEECDILYEGLVYGSTEAAYQAAKSLDPIVRKEFTKLSPKDSKKRGQKIKIREDWNDVKDQVMYDVVKFKFSFHPVLKISLLTTGDRYLEETNYWGDTYWGVCNGRGKNTLGNILMRVRTELKEEDEIRSNT